MKNNIHAPSVAKCLHLKKHSHFFSIQRSIFNWRTPYGYPFAIIFELIAATYMTLPTTYLCNLGFGLCSLFYTIADDLKIGLNSIKKCSKRHGKTEAKVYSDVCKFVRFHADIKQLSGNIL